MKQRKVIQALFLLVIFFCFPLHLFAAEELKPQGFINDFANVLSPAAKSALEQNIQEFEKVTSAEISVVTLTSLDGDAIENKAADIFQAWGIGKKNKDNGVLLLIARDDREARIEVGYGLEPYITDGRAGDIIRNDIVPYFRQEAYDQGIQNAVASLQSLIKAREPETGQERVRGTLRNVLLSFGNRVGFLGIIFFFAYLLSFLARSKSFWLGGVIGGGLSLFLGWVFFALASALALGFFGAVVGLILDYLLSRNYQKQKALGMPTGFWMTGGGFRGGDRGGFGGFGGGSSGGGGASGKW